MEEPLTSYVAQNKRTKADAVSSINRRRKSVRITNLQHKRLPILIHRAQVGSNKDVVLQTAHVLIVNQLPQVIKLL